MFRCDDDRGAEAYIEASQTIFNLDAEGLDADGKRPTFELGCNRDWSVRICPDWVKAQLYLRLSWTSSDAPTAEPNTTDQNRRGCIELAAAGGKPELSM